MRTDARLSDAIELAAYLVASEAIANVLKHAHASQIDLSLVTHDHRLLLTIRDDGVGGADPLRGSGLIGLADRADALGGSIRVESRPDKGTQVTAELPLELETEGNADLAHLVQELQGLTRRCNELVAEGAGNDRELEELENTLERTHWRLARVAQHHATKTLGNATAEHV